MRILLANKFYYRRGGDCIVTMELEKMLKAHGHEVAIFAMDYPENVDSPWKKYWPSNMTKVKTFTRPFGDGEVKAKFNKLLDDFQPDVVHLHNVHTQLSPVIAELAHARGIKVFWTLHDTKLVCPCYTCMRTLSGTPTSTSSAQRLKGEGKMQWCEECFTDKTAVIKNRCMPGSIPGAVIGYLEQRKWNVERLCACTDKFLPPSQFMADTCIRGGYPKEKFEVLCNFIDVNKVPWYCDYKTMVRQAHQPFSADSSLTKTGKTPEGNVSANESECSSDGSTSSPRRLGTSASLTSTDSLAASSMPSGKKQEKQSSELKDYKIELLPKGDYYCYLGRVTEVKGIRTLCEAASQLPYKLKVIGGGDLLDELRGKYPDVEFLGQKDWSEFRPVLEGAKFMVLPSEWSENNPLTVIESQSLGTPVLGARIGGIPELIEEGVSGMTFESGNVEDLKEKIQDMWNAKFDYESLAKNAVSRYSSEAYYERLMNIYNN